PSSSLRSRSLRLLASVGLVLGSAVLGSAVLVPGIDILRLVSYLRGNEAAPTAVPFSAGAGTGPPFSESLRMSPVIAVSGLSKTYASGFQALKRVDLDIRRGEIFALLGPNGAG